MTTPLKDLFFGFNGRIPRRSWWPAFVSILVASVGGSLLVDPNAISIDPDVKTLPAWPDTIWQLALLIPGTAITVKRFNDRDWPFWLGYSYGVAGAAVIIARHYGYLTEPEASAGEMTVLFLSLAVLLFAFVDNGFLRGTKGPNRYGPDPLQAEEPAL